MKLAFIRRGLEHHYKFYKSDFCRKMFDFCFKLNSTENIKPKICKSTRKYIEQLRKSQNKAFYQQISKRKIVHINSLPGHIGRIDPRFSKRIYFPATFAASFPQGRILGENAILTKENYLLTDVSYDFGKHGKNHPIFSQELIPQMKKINGTVAALAVPGGVRIITGYLTFCPGLY